ncbi:MAG: exodeoxyribonuclease VII large subunit [Rhizobiaceae bacterium]
MDDLLPESRSNATEFSVSEISSALKRTVEDVFGNVRVRGEISGYRGPHSSGHAYFALKDERARIEAVIWRGTMSKLRFKPEEGMEVIASGKLTTYPGSSKYQIVIDNLEPAGAGALMALLDERKRKLQAEGLFDPARKQLLPYMPRVIGVVTSPTGAVIRDILHRIGDRFPLHVIVWPVRVQGDTSGAEVAAAVNGFNALSVTGPIPRPDILIVARGGGSLEDLWGFNDEALVRAVAGSHIPVISAVGHETDWTLVDYAADVRAPTPTGAAEIAIPVKADLEATLASLFARLRGGAARQIDTRRQAIRSVARGLPSPDQLFALHRRRFDDAASRLTRGLTVGTERHRVRLNSIRLSPATLLRRIVEMRRHATRDAQRALQALSRGTIAHRQDFTKLAIRLRPDALQRRNESLVNALALVARRLDHTQEARLRGLRTRLVQADRLLSTLKLSHQSILERGYAMVTDSGGNLVKHAAAIRAGDALLLTFVDGNAAVTAKGDGDDPVKREPAPTRPRASKASPPTGQGSLF